MSERIFGRYRELVLVCILLLAPFIVYLSNAKSPHEHNAFDRVVLTVSAPLQWLVVGAMRAGSELWSSYVFLVGVEERNRQLATENASLRSLVAHLEEERLENQRLRLLLEVRESSDDVSMRLARVVATSPSVLFRSIRLDLGSSAGVEPGAPVISHEGAVGRVVTVSRFFSDVMLLTDSNFSTDVIVQRTRAHARIRGAGSDHALGLGVEHMTRTADVEPGDMLITSGSGGVFPKGLRIGHVVSLERRAFGLYQDAVVEPAVDFSRLEEVLVLIDRWNRETSFEIDPRDAERDAYSPMLIESRPGPIGPWREESE